MRVSKKRKGPKKRIADPYAPEWAWTQEERAAGVHLLVEHDWPLEKVIERILKEPEDASL